MRLVLRERMVPLVVLVGVGGALPVGLLLGVGHRMVMFGMNVHFVGVGVSALAATAVSLALTIVGVRRNDGRVVLIGTGFTVMSALLAIHGLATPGVIIGISTLVFWDRWLDVKGGIFLTVIAQSSFIAAYAMLLFMARLQRFDLTLEEVALSLGADDLRTKRYVTLPLIKPGIIAGGFFAFMTSFDNVPVSIFLGSAKLTTLPVKIYSQTEAYGIDPVCAAISTVVIVLTLLLMLLLDRYVGLDHLREG